MTRRTAWLVAAAFCIASIAVPPTSASTRPAGWLGEGGGGTSVSFIRDCPDIPVTQGLDGYVFTLPDSVPPEGQTATVKARAQTDYGVAIFLSAFTEDCDIPINTYGQGTSRLSVDLPPGTRWVVIQTKNGMDIDISLKVHAAIPWS